MKNVKIKSIKKLTSQNAKLKSKKLVKISAAKIDLARINVNIPRSLYNKTKKLGLRSKSTITTIVTGAIKEYVNKLAVPSADANKTRVL